MAKVSAAFWLLIVACSAPVVSSTATTSSPNLSTTEQASTSTTTTAPPFVAGYLVRLDPLTLENMPGLNPIPIGRDTWTVLSSDRSLLVVIEWDGTSQGSGHATTVDWKEWKPMGSFDVGPHSASSLFAGTLYLYDHEAGRLLAVDPINGRQTVLDEWPANLGLWDGLHHLAGDRIAALGARTVAGGQGENSVFAYDPQTKTTIEHAVGTLQRMNEATGFFDGEIEIPEVDDPAVVWADDRLLIVYADTPEVIELDLDTGTTTAHIIDVTSWWDRLSAYWVPTASAKGPTLGTYSSAVLSEDGRYLYISGNRYVPTVAADGNLSEANEHLGVIVVDTETWRLSDSTDLPIQFIRGMHGGVLGVDTTSTQPWTDDYYLLSSDRPGVLAPRGPVTVTDGWCELTPHLRHFLCAEYKSDAIHVRTIDIDTMEAVGDRELGLEDGLSEAVLQDWLPHNDP